MDPRRITPEVRCGRDVNRWITQVTNDVLKDIEDAAKAEVVGADDDDCVILDGNANIPVAVENYGGRNSDESCPVGKKVRVACRDYPHPRHLCVKFPFNSTPHERHCDQCHCYVCGVVAPCIHWSNGASNTDHCHATEKDEFWRAQRQGAKTSYEAPPFVSEGGVTPVIPLPVHNQEPPASQPCSVTTSSCTLYRAIPVRIQESGYHSSNISQPHLVPRDLQRRSVGRAGSQLGPRRVPFKRSGFFGGLMTAIKYINSSPRNSYGSQLSVNQSPGNINFPCESPVNCQSSQSLPAECTQLQNAIVGEKPATSTNLLGSPTSDPHQEDSFIKWCLESLEDLDIPFPRI